MKRILAWLLIAVATVMFAGSAADVESSDARSFLPATAESTRALDVDEATFPKDPDQYLIVYARSAGLTEADRAKADADAQALQANPPIPSADGKALLLITSTQPDITPTDGLEVRITGGAAAEADFDKAFDSLDTTLLLVTVAVVAILLLITYRSPILLLIPLISVAAANQLANALVYWSAKNFGLVVDPQSAGILTVLVFGAGTDYAMLLIARYREERDMRKALRRSLPAIIASGATVILALLTLVFADLNSTRGLGPVAAIGIACAMLAMTTLLPALLVLFGRWAFWPLKPKTREPKTREPKTHEPKTREPKAGEPKAGEHTIWRRVADFVTARPRPIWIATALLLATASLGALTLSIGLKQSDSFTTKPDSVLGFELLAKHYPAGSSDPTYVYTPTESAARVAAVIKTVPGVDHLEANHSTGTWTRLPVILQDDPGGNQAEQTVARIREAAHAAEPTSLVGGSTAQALDQDSTMDRDLTLVIPLILLVVFGVLVALLRAIVAPLLLLASVVLSFGAALGVSAAIFHLIGFPTLDKSVLLNGFLFLVALGVDYTIFLMTRAREDGMTKALTVTGGVITSAGIVLAATFSVLAVMPIVFMLQLGVVVAVGVLLDTFVVRSLLVPALITDLTPQGYSRSHAKI